MSPQLFDFGRNMLHTLLSVIRAVIVELVDQPLRKTCGLG